MTSSAERRDLPLYPTFSRRDVNTKVEVKVVDDPRHTLSPVTNSTPPLLPCQRRVLATRCRDLFGRIRDERP